MNAEDFLSSASQVEVDAMEAHLDQWRLDGNKVVFKDRKKKTPPNMAAAYGEYVKSTGSVMNLIDFEALVVDLLKTRAAAANDEIAFDEYELSEYDRRILEPFRFAVDENFQRILFYKTGKRVFDVKLIGADSVRGKGLEDALVGAGAYSKAKEAYLKIAKELSKSGELPKKLFGASLSVSAESEPRPKPLPFAEYLIKITPLFLRDEAFRISLPKTISNDPNEPAFCHFDPAGIRPGDCPDWDDWLLGMPECCRSVFRAWVYGVFDANNTSRKALWLKSEGYDGKSQVQKAFFQRLRGGVGCISKDSLGNQFGYASIYGARLVVYGDCKNSKLIHSEKIHCLLGGDVVSIERKGEQPFATQLNCKLMVNANCAPEINTSSRNEVTRVIFIPLHEPPARVMAKYCQTHPDGSIIRNALGMPQYTGYKLADRLFEQFDAFLYQCRADYNELCPTGQEIIVPDAVLALLYNNCQSPEENMFETYLREYIEFGSTFSVTGAQLNAHFCNLNKCNSLVYGNFTRLLELRGGRKARPVVDGSKITVWLGIRLREKPVTGVYYSPNRTTDFRSDEEELEPEGEAEAV